MQTKRISQILQEKKLSFSFEIFPPKATATDENYRSIVDTALELSSYKPDFISVTYGAGGGVGKNTISIANTIEKEGGVPALAHLTCISSTRSQIAQVVAELKTNKIQNVLALRGDKPQDLIELPNHYQYSSQLVTELTKDNSFCIGGACYPEGHPESINKDIDLENLKIKVEAGCEFLTTQMFFDNEVLYSFLYRAQSKGIRVPILAGIMPVINASQMKRMISLSNAYVPRQLLSIIDTFGDKPEAMYQAGIAYATEQIIDLIINGVRGIHLYTMNKSQVAKDILANVSHIVAAVNSPTVQPKSGDAT